MKLVLNIALIVILSLCIWGGFKRGLIGGIAGLLAIILSLIGANYVASEFSGEIVPALNPFIGGFVDSETNTDEILARLGYGGTDLSLNDILEQDTSLRYDYAYECMRSIGFYGDVSEDLAQDAVNYSTRAGVSLANAVIVVMCNTIAYAGCITIAFIMILILITAIMDMINLDFHLPNVDVVDEVAGAAMGFVRGFLYCVLLCWLLGFLGLVIGRDTCERTALVSFFQAFRFITRSLI